MKYLITTLALLTLTSVSWSQTQLTPNQLGSGNLPGTHTDLVFTLGDGNWTPEVRLPANGADKASIRIVSWAQYRTQVLQAHSDVPVPAMVLASGQSLRYIYSAARKTWEIDAPTLDVANDGRPLALPVSEHRVVRVRMKDGAWSASVSLPPSALDGAVALVSSEAQWTSRVEPTHVLHASTMPLRTNDAYAFVYSQRLGKWALQRGSVKQLRWYAVAPGNWTWVQDAGDAGFSLMWEASAKAVIPAPTASMTRLEVPARALPTTITLPSRAGDRDRIIITSKATARSAIDNALVQDAGTMTIGKGQTYEFMWNAEAGRWVVLKSPRAEILLGEVKGDAMPAIQSPVTELLAWDGNWKRTVGLPASARAGDRVLVKSRASFTFNVMDAAAPNPLNHAVSQGEEVSFVHDGQHWTRETATIRILLSYGQAVAAKLGGTAARVRQIESLRLTNEALENSGARFRFQMASLIEVPDLATDLGGALQRARDHVLIQNERNRVQADAVYYEGVESGCGLAWVNSSPNSYSMVGTGSLNCGTTVMRHELGHNMGLPHGDGVIATAMSGNAVPYFATPRRFDATLGVHMGHLATRPDEVAIMDRNAPAVAGFR